MTLSTPLVGLALDGAGAHPAAWLEPDSRADELFTAARLVDLVHTAEDAGIDFVTIDDALSLDRGSSGAAIGRLDALLSLARVAPLTTHIGLLPTVTVTHTEPFHVSKNIATLDLVSGGRAGWRVKTSSTQAEADHFGRKTAASEPELLEEAHEAIEIVRRLWDSWEDDAVIRDRPTGRYIDRDKLHYIDFEGAYFRVRGPSITPRPPQGQPIVAVTVHSAAAPTATLAATHADLVVIETTDLDSALLARRCVTRTAAEHGRDIHELRFVVTADVFLGDDVHSAQAERHQLDARVVRTGTRPIDLIGSSREVLDFIATVSARGFDGVLLRPARLPRDLDLLARSVLPVIRSSRSGTANTTSTLRDRLELSRPANRYTLAGATP